MLERLKSFWFRVLATIIIYMCVYIYNGYSSCQDILQGNFKWHNVSIYYS